MVKVSRGQVRIDLDGMTLALPPVHGVRLFHDFILHCIVVRLGDDVSCAVFPRGSQGSMRC